MNRKKHSHVVDSLLSKSKEMLNSKLSAIPDAVIASTSRFRGKLGAAIAVITYQTIGFLTLPNNILYFIDNRHGTRIVVRTAACPDHLSPASGGDLVSIATRSSPQIRTDYEYGYIQAGIAFITLGVLSMVASVVMSFFAAESKEKMDNFGSRHGSPETAKSTRTVWAYLIFINLELLMSIIAGCMELLYRPLISDEKRLHTVECVIAAFNIIVFIMYGVSVMMTATVLKEQRFLMDQQRDLAPENVVIPSSCKDYSYRNGSTRISRSSFM